MKRGRADLMKRAGITLDKAKRDHTIPALFRRDRQGVV
jgi:hypothetical protein